MHRNSLVIINKLKKLNSIFEKNKKNLDNSKHDQAYSQTKKSLESAFLLNFNEAFGLALSVSTRDFFLCIAELSEEVNLYNGEDKEPLTQLLCSLATLKLSAGLAAQNTAGHPNEDSKPLNQVSSLNSNSSTTLPYSSPTVNNKEEQNHSSNIISNSNSLSLETFLQDCIKSDMPVSSAPHLTPSLKSSNDFLNNNNEKTGSNVLEWDFNSVDHPLFNQEGVDRKVLSQSTDSSINNNYSEMPSDEILVSNEELSNTESKDNLELAENYIFNWASISNENAPTTILEHSELLSAFAGSDNKNKFLSNVPNKYISTLNNNIASISGQNNNTQGNNNLNVNNRVNNSNQDVITQAVSACKSKQVTSPARTIPIALANNNYKLGDKVNNTNYLMKDTFVKRSLPYSEKYKNKPDNLSINNNNASKESILPYLSPAGVRAFENFVKTRKQNQERRAKEHAKMAEQYNRHINKSNNIDFNLSNVENDYLPPLLMIVQSFMKENFSRLSFYYEEKKGAIINTVVAYLNQKITDIEKGVQSISKEEVYLFSTVCIVKNLSSRSLTIEEAWHVVINKANDLQKWQLNQSMQSDSISQQDELNKAVLFLINHFNNNNKGNRCNSTDVHQLFLRILRLFFKDTAPEKERYVNSFKPLLIKVASIMQIKGVGTWEELCEISKTPEVNAPLSSSLFKKLNNANQIVPKNGWEPLSDLNPRKKQKRDDDDTPGMPKYSGGMNH